MSGSFYVEISAQKEKIWGPYTAGTNELYTLVVVLHMVCYLKWPNYSCEASLWLYIWGSLYWNITSKFFFSLSFFCSGALKKSHDSGRVIIATLIGLVFGFFVGVSFPSVSLTKVYLALSMCVYLEFKTYIHLTCLKLRRLTYLQALYRLLM